MDAEAQVLWKKLVDFKFDEPGATLTFAARLARENGWRLGYAKRVIEEYRRFLFLSMVSGHAVSPSEAIDQAWHLHLTYTKSYWTQLCGEVLPRPLHHCPTKGGNEETEKFDSWYTRTLESYEHFFEQAPPADIWPPVGEQMESAADSRWVDTNTYFLIPRNPLKWLTFALLLIVPVVMFGGCAADAPMPFQPFDFDGPTFLKFFALIGGLSLVMAVSIRFLYPCQDPPIPVEVETPAQKVYLAQGPKGLVLAAIAKMIEEKTLQLKEIEGGWISGKKYQLETANPLPIDASEVEKQIYRSVPDSKPGELGKLVAKVIPLAIEEGAILQEMGLIEPNPCESFIRRWVPSLMMAGVAALGTVKIFVGLSRNKPVFLLILMVAVAVVAAIWLFRRGFRTSAGESVLRNLRSEHSHLGSAVRGSDGFSGEDIFLAAGIFGLSTIAMGQLGYLDQEVRRSTYLNNSGYAGCGGAGCSSSCGSGCGSSCGSGCGSGCGGCGGD